VPLSVSPTLESTTVVYSHRDGIRVQTVEKVIFFTGPAESATLDITRFTGLRTAPVVDLVICKSRVAKI
jgi:hypothetical protein